MTDSDGSIEKTLFPKGTEFGDLERAQLLEQYKIMVQSSETLVARRQSVNTFFLSVNTLLLTAVGLVVREEIAEQKATSEVLLFVLGITGVLLAFAWRRLVTSYRQLNTGKFQVIDALEEHLPASMFAAEWEALGRGRDKGKYRPFTATEAVIPWVFGAIYVVAVVQGVIGFDWVTS